MAAKGLLFTNNSSIFNTSLINVQECKKKMKKRPTNDDSDEFDVDEPEEFEESGSDWDPEDETAGKKRKGRAKAPGKKANKKKKIEKPPSEDEEEEENEDEEEDEEDEEDEGEEEEESEEESAGPEQAGADGATTPDISVKAFTNGSFVVLKSDFKSKEDPPLWKIDGKALLQKYIPFDLDGRTVYKNTSTYSGWTPSNQNQYAPAPVTYVQQGKKVIIIEFNKDKVQLGDENNDAKKETPETVDA